MSAVAPVAEVSAVTLQLVPEKVASAAELATKEQNRWMLWFGLPALFMAIFVGAVFATGAKWLLGGSLAFLIADIGILIWLCMSSDTNGLIGAEAPAPH